MKKFLLLLLFAISCHKIDLSLRSDHFDKVCLVVEPKIRLEDVQEAAEVWNKRMEKNVFRLSPECRVDDHFVMFFFVEEVPEGCFRDGCTKTRKKDGSVVWKDVFVQENADFSTIIHELGHIVGCKHSDLDFPCRPVFN